MSDEPGLASDRSGGLAGWIDRGEASNTRSMSAGGDFVAIGPFPSGPRADTLDRMWTWTISQKTDEWYYLAWIGEFSCSIFPNEDGTAEWGIVGPENEEVRDGAGESVDDALSQVLAAIPELLAELEARIADMRGEYARLREARLDEAQMKQR